MRMPWSRVIWFGLLVITGLTLGLTLSTLDPRTDQRTIQLIGVFMIVLIPLLIGSGWLLSRYGNASSPQRDLADRILLIQAGHGHDVLAQARARQRDGDTTPENALVMATAYTAQGRAGAAEPHARAALDSLRAQGTFDSDTPDAQWLGDLAVITLYNALLAQGSFQDAAATANTWIPRSGHPVFGQTLVAWAHYLGEHHDDARATLAEVPPTAVARRRLAPRFELALRWMRYTLQGEPLPDLARFEVALAEWESEASRHAHTPYGFRLRQVLAEVREQTR